MIAYILTKHLQPSQTFIHNEISEVRRQGAEIRVVSIEHGEARDPEVTYLADMTPSWVALAGAHTRAVLRSPAGYVRFLRRARAMRGEMGRKPEQVPWTLLPLLAEELRRDQVHHLHAHFAWSGAAAADLLAALTGLPWSVTLHAKDIFSKQRYLERKLADADLLVTVCRYNEEWMRRHLHLTRAVHQVVCGVEVPERPWPREGAADVIAVGRLVPKKGFDTLVRAVALMTEHRPGIRVDVVGDGASRDELVALIAELGVQDQVRLLGARSHQESLARIAGARVFALPCRVAADGDRDSMPVVIKEAMIREVPVVASDVVAVAEMLGDGCGVMIPPDDPLALAQALEGLLSDPVAAADLAQRARTRALQNFTLSGEVAKLHRLFVPQTGSSPLPERRP